MRKTRKREENMDSGTTKLKGVRQVSTWAKRKLNRGDNETGHLRSGSVKQKKNWMVQYNA
jgi:hypothetical protein